jgi:hypothetical protein
MIAVMGVRIDDIFGHIAVSSCPARQFTVPPSTIMSARAGPRARENSLHDRLEELDPFWAAQLVIAGTIVLDFALPSKVIRPFWLLPSIEANILG